MPNRSSKQASRDISEIAARVLSEATGETTERIAPEDKEKNPTAVALGRLGGIKGSKAHYRKVAGYASTFCAAS